MASLVMAKAVMMEITSRNSVLTVRQIAECVRLIALNRME